MRTWYIYKITNLLNDKSYVGQHITNKKPLKDKYMGSGFYLKSSIKKHGLQNFKKEILISELTSQFAANIFEEYFIKKEETLYPKGYNLLGSCIQVEFSKATLEKMSKSHKGQVSHNKGKNLSEETKKKISKTLKGRVSPKKGKKMSEEQKQKISLTSKGRTAWNKGKQMSKEFKEECRKRNKGKKHSKETIEKLAKFRKGKRHSEETKQKIGLKHKGKKYLKTIKNN
jgi:group I intron endonuclease